MAWWKREVLSISRRSPVSCIPGFGSVNVLYQETEVLECCTSIATPNATNHEVYAQLDIHKSSEERERPNQTLSKKSTLSMNCLASAKKTLRTMHQKTFTRSKRNGNKMKQG